MPMCDVVGMCKLSFQFRGTAVGQYRRQVIDGPLNHRPACRYKRLCPVGKAVFNPRRHFGKHLTHQKAISLEITQCGGKYLRRRIRQRLSQLAETHWPSVPLQCIQHQQRPLIAHTRQHIAHRTIRKKHFTYFHHSIYLIQR